MFMIASELTYSVILFYTDKLDGLGSSGKRKRDDMTGMDHFLQLPDDYATRMSEPGKKRVNKHTRQQSLT